MKPRGILVILENLSLPFARRLWQECVALRRAGYRVVVVCPRAHDSRPFELLEGIPIYRYPLLFMARRPAGYLLEYGWSLLCIMLYSWWVFIRHGFRIIHQANPPDFILPALLPFRWLGVRFVYEHLDLSPEMYEANFARPRPWLQRLLLTFERWSMHTADMIITTNESFRRLTSARCNVPAECMFIVRTAPDPERFRSVEPNPIHRAGRKYLVAYLGVMGLHDGVDLLLQSIEFIYRRIQRNDITFVLIGGGELLPGWKQMAVDLGIADVTTFTGRIPDQAVCEILSTADVCAAPDPINSMNTRSTMCKVLEYMIMAKPIVSYDLLETRASADNAAVYALQNDPTEFARMIVELLADPRLRMQMGQAGHDRVSTSLSWRNSEAALLSAYANLEQHSRGAHRRSGRRRKSRRVQEPVT
jgi:glycosyltransferase involved in cell wall biosynthesis